MPVSGCFGATGSTFCIAVVLLLGLAGPSRRAFSSSFVSSLPSPVVLSIIYVPDNTSKSESLVALRIIPTSDIV